MEPNLQLLLKKIRLLTGKKLNSLFIGEYHSAFKGHGLEFNSVREYQYGDDIRNVDWNVSARMNHLFIKEYIEERELSVVLALDISGSVEYGSGEKSKSGLILEIASLFLYLAQMNNDRVSVLLFTDRVEKFIRPRKGRKYILKVLDEIINCRPESRKTGIANALEFLSRVQKKRSIIFLISDFLDMDDYMPRLRLMSKKHDIIPVQVSDPAERENRFFGLTEFIDLESGESFLSDSVPGKTGFADFEGFNYISLSTDKPLESLSSIISKEGTEAGRLKFVKDILTVSLSETGLKIMKIKKISYTIFFVLSGVMIFTLLSARAYAGNSPVTIEAAANPAKGTVGIPVEYKISISADSLDGIDINLPEKKEFYQEKKVQKEGEPAGDEVPLYIIHGARKEDNSGEGVDYITIIISISYYKPGKYQLPLIDVRGEDGIQIGYRMPDLEITPLNEKGELQEIEPPLELGGNYYRIILLVLAAVALTLISVFLFRYFKKRKETASETAEYISPIEIFMDELSRLNGEELIRAGKVEEYAVGISIIFRKFISLLYKIDAMEMTSEELESAVMKRIAKGYGIEATETISRSLRLWDLSKFAEFTPSNEILLGNLEGIKKAAKKISEGGL